MTGITTNSAAYTLALVAFLATASSAMSSQLKQPVTVDDAICMTKVASPSDEVAHFSPDGQHFVIVLKKGDLEHNRNDYSVLLWRTDGVFHGGKPEILVTFSSSSSRPAISDLRWLDNSTTLVFLGERPGETQQLYSLDVTSRAPKKVASSETSLVSYTMSSDGQRLLYATERPQTNLFDQKARRQGLVASTESINDIIIGHEDASSATFYGKVQFYVENSDRTPKRVSADVLSPVGFDPPVMSPDGRYAVILAVVNSVPEAWKDYLDPTIQWWTQRKRTPLPTGQRVLLLQTMILNTSTLEIRPLLNAPTSTSSYTEVAWSADSRSVIVTNTYLPLADGNLTDRDTRLRKVFSAVEVRVPEGKVFEISLDDLHSPSWLSLNRVVCAVGRSKWDKTTTNVVFDKSGGSWKKVGEEHIQYTRPQIIEEEGLNSPPKIVAVDPETGQRAVLLDLNPHFAEVRFAHEEAIEWKGTDGHQVRGGLYFPLDYEPGKQYPLVIQTHAFRPDKFWIDGPFSTAFAAQPLAGRGFMVLQMDEDPSDSDSPKEVDREVAGLEGAIDFLDQKGFIDRNRIGVIGFSRTCLHVKFALTHSKYHFAAASVTDGVDNGYFQYILENTLTAFDEALEGSNGGIPFGQGLKAWMNRSPGFNADRVSTPTLIFAPNPSSALFQWEWFAALRRLRRPVEMVVAEDDEHELQKPWNRRISLQGNVDWFRFWLKDEEDPDSAKQEQYKRWRELRKLQRDNEAKAKAATVN